MKLFTFVLIIVSALQAPAAVLKYKTTGEDGHLEFLAIGRPAMIRIKGESTGPRGSIEITDLKAQGEFTLPLASLNTGIEMRDEHMKQKYLEVAKNPDAVLKITTLTLTNAEKGQDVPFTGTLTLHGTTKNVDGHVNYQTAAGAKKTHADFKIRLSDFGIAIPTYAGLTVADEVQVQVDVNLRAE